MMNTTGMGTAFPALWAVHIASVVMVFVGIIFIILWAAKTLTQAQMKMWGIVLLVIGTIACLLTISVRGAPWIGGGMMENGCMMKGGQMNMMEKMMGGMMGNDAKQGMKMGMGIDDAMDMSMEDMAEMLEGKSGDDFDAAFLEGMIPHHQGAIDMAEAALQSARHDEIRTMARAIISAQQQEIDQMREWQKNWGYTR